MELQVDAYLSKRVFWKVPLRQEQYKAFFIVDEGFSGKKCLF